MINKSIKLLCTTVIYALACSPTVQGQVIPRDTRSEFIGNKIASTQIPTVVLDQETEVFVRLDMPSVAQFCVKAIEQGDSIPDHRMQSAHADKIRQQQDMLRQRLQTIGVQELSSLKAGANGLRIRVNSRKLAQIRQLPNVLSVAPVTRYTPSLAASNPWIGVPGVHNTLSDGTNINIAIIDGGIDYLHANFGGSGIPDDYANNDKTVIEPGTFPTAKVVGGYDFAGSDYDGTNDPTPDPDPLDGNGHGTHVAGIAAGLGVPGKIAPGVAKGASLYALKVFGDNDDATSTTLVSDAIEWALDPNGDGSTDDHLDVINLSLGSGFGNANDPAAIAAKNAAELGVIVVAAVGNNGDVPYVSAAPAVYKNIIAVASSVAEREVPALSVTTPQALAGQYEAVEGPVSPPLSDIGPISGQLITPAHLDNHNGCASISNNMDNQIALIERGSCQFSEKFLNAQAAGAKAVVVYNNEANTPPMPMGGDSTNIEIPGVMITQEAGLLLANSADPIAVELSDSITTLTRFADTVSGFSSSGPGRGGSVFKPDVSAPGHNIVSSAVGSGDGTATQAGTSMASPQVAGLAALLRDLHPTLSPASMKAMIQNATVPALRLDGSGYPLTRQGTGIVRVNQAVNLSSSAKPGGVSFGRINPLRNTRKRQWVQIHNMASQARDYQITHEPNQTVPGVTVTCPQQVSVPKRGGKRISIELAMDPSLGPFDDGLHSQREIDGWCVLDDGVDVLRVGYIAVIDPASNMRVRNRGKDLLVENTGPSLGWASGFTQVGHQGERLDRLPHAIKAVGVRTQDFFAADDRALIQFAIATERPWETLSAYIIQIDIDRNEDGVDDFSLLAADFSSDGRATTAIFPQGFELFETTTDLNDNAVTLTFFKDEQTPLGPLGFLKAGDATFNYRVQFISRDDFSFDVQAGSIDLSREIISEINTFGLQPGDSFRFATSGPRGNMLWLFQNNPTHKQSHSIRTRN